MKAKFRHAGVSGLARLHPLELALRAKGRSAAKAAALGSPRRWRQEAGRILAHLVDGRDEGLWRGVPLVGVDADVAVPHGWSRVSAEVADVPSHVEHGWWFSPVGADARVYRVLLGIIREGTHARDVLQFDGNIDAVFTWVDDDDPAWQARRSEAKASADEMHATASAASRFSNHDELKAALRSVEAYAPWIDHVYIVTDRQRPRWLRQDCDWVSVVDHAQILPGECLPTFNSHVVESALHHIPGLAGHYLYLNDDMMLGAPARPEDFFTPFGQVRTFPSGQGLSGDLPVIAAARVNSAVLDRLTGQHMRRRYRHAAYAQNLELNRALASQVERELHRTRAQPFRSPGDVSFAASLSLSYATAVGAGVPSDLSYEYIDLGERDAPLRLARLCLRGTPLAVCLNQVATILPEVESSLGRLLEVLWPWPGDAEAVQGLVGE